MSDDDFKAPAATNPQQSERDEAVEIARDALKIPGPVECAAGNVKLLARQLLRALALPA